MGFNRASRMLIRVSAVTLLAASSAACSDLPEWMGGDPAPAQSAPISETQGAATDTAAPQGKTVAEASDQYPVLADTPSKAPPTTSSDEQKQVANALVADRTQAQYSADALQAGNVAAAEPPPPASAEASPTPPAPNAVAPASVAPASSASSAPPPAPAPARTASAEPTGRSPMPGTLPAEGETSIPETQVASATP